MGEWEAFANASVCGSVRLSQGPALALDWAEPAGEHSWHIPCPDVTKSDITISGADAFGPETER